MKAEDRLLCRMMADRILTLEKMLEGNLTFEDRMKYSHRVSQLKDQITTLCGTDDWSIKEEK